MESRFLFFFNALRAKIIIFSAQFIYLFIFYVYDRAYMFIVIF